MIDGQLSEVNNSQIKKGNNFWQNNHHKYGQWARLYRFKVLLLKILDKNVHCPLSLFESTVT